MSVRQPFGMARTRDPNRKCSKCGEEGPFNGTSNYCKKCMKEYLHNLYNNGYRAKTKLNRDANCRSIRVMINEAKMKPCVDCHVNYPFYVMDLDHCRGKKLFNLSRAANCNYALDKVAAEIAKCDPVCANCHRQRTFKRLGEAGIEPARLATKAFKASASTCSATRP